MLSAQSLCALPIPQPECDRSVVGAHEEGNEEVEEEEKEGSGDSD